MSHIVTRVRHPWKRGNRRLVSFTCHPGYYFDDFDHERSEAKYR